MHRIKKLFGIEDETPVSNVPVGVPTKEVQDLKVDSNENVKPTLAQTVDKTLRKYVPLEEGDCLSCKLLSMGAISGALIFVGKTAFQVGPKQPTRTKKILTYVHCSVVSVALVLLGYGRFFDTGLFDKDNNVEQNIKDFIKKIKNKD